MTEFEERQQQNYKYNTRFLVADLKSDRRKAIMIGVALISVVTAAIVAFLQFGGGSAPDIKRLPGIAREAATTAPDAATESRTQAQHNKQGRVDTL